MSNNIKPKKKSITPVFRLENMLYIEGSEGSVYTTQVPDPTGCIKYLFQLMDGSRTVAQLHELVQRKYPEVTSEDLADAIMQFDQAGFLENGAFSPEGLLDEYELTRWDRNIGFFETLATTQVNKYMLQYRLKTARVAVLGLGGSGSHLLYDLAAMGVHDIRAVDYDRVELSNLNRQILYNEADIGRLKTEVAAERVRAFNSRVQLDIVPMRLSSTEDVLRVIHDRDYVICVVDRPKMEVIHWVNEACVRQHAKLIAGGVDKQRALCWSVIPGTTGCAECWYRQKLQQSATSGALLEEKRRLQFGSSIGDRAAFVGLVSFGASFMLSEFVRMATGIAPPFAAGRVIEIQFGSMEMREAERWERLADCPVCQAVEPQPLFSLGDISSVQTGTTN